MSKFAEKFYDIFMYPLEAAILKKRRKEVISSSNGDILEIGSGTGSNFEFYNYKKLNTLTVADLETSFSVMNYNFPVNTKVKFVKGNVEKLSFADNTFDSVVFTLLFCTVNNPHKGFEEIYRVLKPGGKIYFIEHVSPENKHLKGIVNKINPTWTKLANGCNLNRNTIDAIVQTGYEIEKYHKHINGLFIDGVARKPITN